MFAGIGSSKNDSDSDDEKKKKKKDKKKKAEEESKADLVNLGGSQASTATDASGLGNLLDFDPKPAGQNTVLIDDIFSTPSQQPQ